MIFAWQEKASPCFTPLARKSLGFRGFIIKDKRVLGFGETWNRQLDVGHAVLQIGTERAAPVHGGFFVREAVVDIDAGDFAFAKAQGAMRAYWSNSSCDAFPEGAPHRLAPRQAFP